VYETRIRQLTDGLKFSPCQRLLAGRATRLATSVHSHTSVCNLFSFYFFVIIKLQQPNHEAQIYFVFFEREQISEAIHELL
jgi:hypothetical protein